MWVMHDQGRMVVVGDPAQAIYGFSGATNDAMELFKRDLQSSELPLSVTYRCPKAIVSLAQQWVPDITAHESAPEGTVTTIQHTALWRQPFRPQDVILCRNTRPLLGIARRLRGQGVECVVEGTSGKSLISLASKWGELPIGAMLERLSEYRSLESAKWMKKNCEDKAEQVAEKCDMLRDLAEDMDNDLPVSKLISRIQDMFGEGENRKSCLRLCTIHRSKGREWDRVYLVGRNEYMPSKWAKVEWEVQQEHNLMYVAVTRVKSELVEVIVPPKKQKRGGGEPEPDWWEL